jgi:hypothetical protein
MLLSVIIYELNSVFFPSGKKLIEKCIKKVADHFGAKLLESFEFNILCKNLLMLDSKFREIMNDEFQR